MSHKSSYSTWNPGPFLEQNAEPFLVGAGLHATEEVNGTLKATAVVIDEGEERLDVQAAVRREVRPRFVSEYTSCRLRDREVPVRRSPGNPSQWLPERLGCWPKIHPPNFVLNSVLGVEVRKLIDLTLNRR